MILQYPYTGEDDKLCASRFVLRLFDMYMSYGCGSTGENVTPERYTTWRQICPKTWRQSVTRRDVRYVPRKTRFRYMAPSREWSSCLVHIAIRELASGSMLLDISRVPQYHCARPVTCHSRYDNWTLIGLRCFWILLEFRNTIVRVSGHVSFTIQ